MSGKLRSPARAHPTARAQGCSQCSLGLQGQGRECCACIIQHPAWRVQQGEWEYSLVKAGCLNASPKNCSSLKAVVSTEPGWPLVSPAHSGPLENWEMVSVQPCFCPRQLVATFRALSSNQLTGFSFSPSAIPVAGSGWIGDELLGGLLL